ncbi:hypothetical protein StrepF001_29415 [Streptomyces sp. F001]|uniref:hypothetical protein n=1 Tax=Streptomyces sp. F001 TaxID=1510026 RepID=UPI00101E3E8D|nr:hypothetical protein [Streptomyces sp. F001]RZB15875.1 hypothetical protein StrepF001_29415 [Streptomyces sp. F001]
MIGNLFTVAELEPAALRAALADLLTVPNDAVDVANAEEDQDGRRWDAPVLCTCRRLPPGDLAWELDITVDDATVGGDFTEAGIAQGLAARTKTPVLWPSALELPSDYWIAVPDGRVVRCRLDTIENDQDTAYRVDVTEEPVPGLPRARVEILPEILDRDPIETPLSDTALADYPTGPTATVEGRIHYALRTWERLVHRLQTDWSPSGHYREDLYHRDLEARDLLHDLLPEVPEDHVTPLWRAVTQLDQVFRAHTEPATAKATEHWWRYRIPHHIPW